MATSVRVTTASAAQLPKSSQSVAMELRYAIAAGRFHPHEHLIEEHLASLFETNRSVIRSALAILEQEGLIVRERNRGARVKALAPEAATELFEVRAVLEGLIARHAAMRIDDAGVSVLTKIVARMHEFERADDFRGYVQANGDFHRAIAEIAKHTAASRHLDVIQSQSIRYQFRSVVYRGRITESLAEHEAILAALEQRDPDAAERMTRHHVERIGDVLRQISPIELLA